MATASVNLSEVDLKSLPEAGNMRFALVVAEWNGEITSNLADGAVETLKAAGVPETNISRQEVPGSFELVYGARKFCEQSKYDAVIAVGCVIQGETRHFDFVCQGVTQGIQELNLNYDTPVIFCVLTDNTIEQSRARSGGKHGNKGVEAAVSAIKMAALRKEFAHGSPVKGFRK
jgi:6,7-dimethyl-8-ribityllumazine synthase